MKNYVNRLLASFMLGVCLISFLPGASVCAKAPYYKIPQYEDFRPNKAANDIEAIVNKKSVINCTAIDNKVVIDGEEVAKVHNEAVSEIEGYINKLNKNGLYLNRELVNTVTVQIKGINFSEFVEVLIDNNNLTEIADVSNLKIVFQNKNEYIALDKESIALILSNHKAFKIQIKKLSDTYTVRFLSMDDNIISKYGVDIKIALPAKHSEQTVYLFMNNTQENWGGQYNASIRAIEFMTKYSGEYNVASPEVAINDIESLSKYEQQAIRFMVVRGYLGVKNKKFSPDANLTRYDFAEALVRMFFALDNEAKCSFPDVDKKHYRYVAASVQSNIVQGFDDGTFRGKRNVTVEQVIALAARTINQKNGYVYPENTAKYLNFSEDNVISRWAEKEIALAIREGIYSNDMNLAFSEDILRKDAAVILYRLFMIMNNTPEPTEIVEYDDVSVNKGHRTIWNKTNAIITVSSVVIINVIALVLSVYIRKKRNNTGL